MTCQLPAPSMSLHSMILALCMHFNCLTCACRLQANGYNVSTMAPNKGYGSLVKTAITSTATPMGGDCPWSTLLLAARCLLWELNKAELSQPENLVLKAQTPCA